MKYFILALILASCQSTRIMYSPPDDIQLAETTMLQLYQFDYDTSIPTFGKAFIADGIMYTAAHIIASEYVCDLGILGPSPIKGLSICDATHHKGDFFYYKTLNQIKDILFFADDDLNYYVVSPITIKGGDSGSPVFDHDSVLRGIKGQIVKLNNHTIPLAAKVKHEIKIF